jgi:anhydro-N-acetylmuramic acid kinase
MVKYNVIGMMSGSSLDGLDVCQVTFVRDTDSWSYEVKAAACYEYDQAFRESLRQVAHETAIAFAQMHTSLGRIFSNYVLDFLANHSHGGEVDLIVSHGQTIFHQPEKGFTTQIGCGATIAALLKKPVVCDLRTVDVALGGQGAPLVPMGERYLFPEFQQFLNIGGISNIAIHEKEGVRAFDVCPGNTLLNYFAQKAGCSFDRDGVLAQSGQVQVELLAALNDLPFYQLVSPKSLGTEHLMQQWLPLLEEAQLSNNDSLRTLVEHIAIQVAAVAGTNEMLVTGGGAFNSFLMERITALAPCKVLVPDAQTVAYKEAIIIGFLGLLRYLGLPNALASVTGASTNSIGGAIYFAG